MITIIIVALNVLVWFYELLHGVDLSALDYGIIPAWVLNGVREGHLRLPGVGAVTLYQEVPHPLTLFTSMFIHGSWMHLIGNMWFLWLFGDNVEEAMGRARFVVFYLVCGLAAALAQILAVPHSTMPMVGASGAIAGVLGGYLILFPRARVRCLWILIIFITTIVLPAWLLLGLWFLSQFFIPTHSGVAWMAHVGGFVAGVALVRVFTLGRWPRPEPPPSVFYQYRYR
ncbi:MAG TPA: rhomboid family intramembrane serine protease [Polyangia bacterium]|nr:rhomboid family intramembrane serine protease [Polyangia bacterium]